MQMQKKKHPSGLLATLVTLQSESEKTIACPIFLIDHGVLFA